MEPRLRILHEEIDARARGVTGGAGEWPCRKGCDACCRSLAAVPSLTAPEWELLSAAIAQLPPGVRRGVEERARNLSGARPVVCPLLDAAAGACLVYEARPVACRTYGFYVDRDAGLYCSTIRDRVDAGACANVVWGNNAAIETRLDALGPRTDLRILFALSAPVP